MAFWSQRNTPSMLVVGLGNPGLRYTATRHNVGFLAVDSLATQLGSDNWRTRFDALFAEKTLTGAGSIVLAKPQTMMNASGRAVKGLSKHFSLNPGKIVVIHDDLDLPAGTLRIKSGGGHGGHNGIRDIIAAIGPDFLRIKIGIGRPPGRMEAYDYVLQQLRGDTLEELKVDATRAADAALAIMRDGLTAAQTQYN